MNNNNISNILDRKIYGSNRPVISGRSASMVTEAAGQNPQTGQTRTTGHVSGLTFVKLLEGQTLKLSLVPDPH